MTRTFLFFAAPQRPSLARNRFAFSHQLYPQAGVAFIRRDPSLAREKESVTQSFGESAARLFRVPHHER